jgi:hypothetical protein
MPGSYDLSTFEGRAAWGYEAFYAWLSSLSSDASTALRLISGSDYKAILPFLRNGNRRSWLDEFHGALGMTARALSSMGPP